MYIIPKIGGPSQVDGGSFTESRMIYDDRLTAQQLAFWIIVPFAICFLVSFVIGEMCQHWLQHPWRHLTSSTLDGGTIGTIFFLWRRMEFKHMNRMQRRAVAVRNHLQILMLRPGCDDEAKKAIRRISSMLEPD